MFSENYAEFEWMVTRNNIKILCCSKLQHFDVQWNVESRCWQFFLFIVSERFDMHLDELQWKKIKRYEEEFTLDNRFSMMCSVVTRVRVISHVHFIYSLRASCHYIDVSALERQWIDQKKRKEKSNEKQIAIPKNVYFFFHAAKEMKII